MDKVFVTFEIADAWEILTTLITSIQNFCLFVHIYPENLKSRICFNVCLCFDVSGFLFWWVRFLFLFKLNSGISLYPTQAYLCRFKLYVFWKSLLQRSQTKAFPDVFGWIWIVWMVWWLFVWMVCNWVWVWSWVAPLTIGVAPPIVAPLIMVVGWPAPFNSGPGKAKICFFTAVLWDAWSTTWVPGKPGPEFYIYEEKAQLIYFSEQVGHMETLSTVTIHNTYMAIGRYGVSKT